jgi:hypothetical protein
MAFDLNALPAYYEKKYGVDRFAEITGKSKSVTAMQLRTGKTTLDDVAKLLAFDPAPLAEIRPLYTNPEKGKKLVILVPLSTPPAPKMVDSLIRLHDRAEMAYERFSFNCLSVSRNVLAARFMAGAYDWGWWMDGDALLPAGDAPWYKDAAGVPEMPDVFAGLNSIYRALFHKKTIVSSCYVGRKSRAAPQFGGGDAAQMRQLVRGGPRDKLIEVPWCGFGGILTHRSVFDDIVKVMGDEIRMKPGGIGDRFGYSYGFFDALDRESPADDIPFCNRAIRSGHKVYVDLAIQAAHIGDRAYTYKDL